MARFRPLVLEDLKKIKYRLPATPIRGPKSLTSPGESEQKTPTIAFFSVKRKGVSPTPAVLLSIESSSPIPSLKHESSPGRAASPSNLRLSSSQQLLARFKHMDQGIQLKVDETYVSTREQDEAALKVKVAEIENSPVNQSKARKSEGLVYPESHCERQSVPPFEPARRRLRSQAADRAPRLSTKGRTSLQRTEFPVFPFKSKQEILKDIQQTMERSYEFLSSAQSMSRELSRHFLRAPVLRPRSRAMQV